MRQGLVGQYARELAPEESFFKRKFEECQHELNAIRARIHSQVRQRPVHSHDDRCEKNVGEKRSRS